MLPHVHPGHSCLVPKSLTWTAPSAASPTSEPVILSEQITLLCCDFFRKNPCWRFLIILISSVYPQTDYVTTALVPSQVLNLGFQLYNFPSAFEGEVLPLPPSSTLRVLLTTPPLHR